MMPNLNLWLIPVLPLIGAALNGLFGKRLTRQAVASTALAFSGAAFGLALFVAARFSTLELPHVDAGACEQLSGDVYRLGGRGTGVVSADWILFPARFRRIGRQESIHR